MARSGMAQCPQALSCVTHPTLRLRKPVWQGVFSIVRSQACISFHAFSSCYPRSTSSDLSTEPFTSAPAFSLYGNGAVWRELPLLHWLFRLFCCFPQLFRLLRFTTGPSAWPVTAVASVWPPAFTGAVGILSSASSMQRPAQGSSSPSVCIAFNSSSDRSACSARSELSSACLSTFAKMLVLPWLSV